MSGFYKIFLKNKKPRSSDSFSAIFNKQKEQKKLDKSGLVSSAPEVASSVISPLTINSTKNFKPKARKLNKEELNSIHSYMSHAVRNSSRKLYEPQWIKYKKFCSDRKLAVSSSESISLFMISLAESSNSKSSALAARSAIKFYLKLSSPGKKCPSDSFMVSRVAKSITKKYAKAVKKAKTLDSVTIKKLVLNLLESGTLVDERSAVFFLVQYIIFGRYEEISSLSPSSLKFLDNGHLEVHVEKAKNFDVFDSKKSYISKGSENFEPVSIIKNYVSKLGDSKFLFPNFRVEKKKIVFLEKSVSYSNMLKLLRSSLDKIGLEGKAFSLHSLRTGALSEASNGSVDKVALQRHARWKTPNMVDYYREISLDKKLEASRALALYD